jgi:hypothetical protein
VRKFISAFPHFDALIPVARTEKQKAAINRRSPKGWNLAPLRVNLEQR